MKVFWHFSSRSGQASTARCALALAAILLAGCSPQLQRVEDAGVSCWRIWEPWIGGGSSWTCERKAIKS